MALHGERAYRILHVADIHLETACASDHLPPAVGLEKRAGLRRTLRRMLKIAQERNVQAVTIGGDLYDGEYALPELGNFLADEFRSTPSVHVFVAPGEHDPHTHPSIYSVTKWPSNVTIFPAGAATRIELTPGIQLTGVAVPIGRDRSSWRKGTIAGDVNILLAHALDADRESAMRSDIYAITALDVADAGYDIALLGHEHSGRVWPCEAPRCVYPGSAAVLSREEAQAQHTAVLVTIDKGSIALESIPINDWRYFTVSADLTDCASPGEMAIRVEEQLDAVGARHDKSACYIVRLTGRPASDVYVRSIAEQIESKAYVQLTLHLDPPHDLEYLSKERTVRGTLALQALQRLDTSPDESEREIRATSLALHALEGKQGGFDAL